MSADAYTHTYIANITEAGIEVVYTCTKWHDHHCEGMGFDGWNGPFTDHDLELSKSETKYKEVLDLEGFSELWCGVDNSGPLYVRREGQEEGRTFWPDSELRLHPKEVPHWVIEPSHRRTLLERAYARGFRGIVAWEDHQLN